MKKLLASQLSFFLLLIFVSTPTAHAAPTVTTIYTATYPIVLAEDSSGNIYIGDETNTDASKNGVVVIPAASGTLYGRSVTAGTAATLVSSAGVKGIAFSPSGILVYSLSNGDIYALSSTNSTLFGTSLTANTATKVATGTSLKGPLDFDALGNLYGVYITTGNFSVLPVSSGTLYGVSVTANTSAVLYTNASNWFWDLALDSNGNIFVTDGWGLQGVFVLSKTSTTLYGQSVTANTFTRLSIFGTARYAGIDVDSNNDLYVNEYGTITKVVSATSKTLFETALTANTVASISGTTGYVNQGLLVLQNGNLIQGGPSSTLKLVAAVPIVIASFNSLALAGSATTATYRTPVVITANVNVAAKVTFKINGKALPGCNGRLAVGSGSTFVTTCSWKPSSRGSVSLLAIADPVADGISNGTSSPISVGVVNRTGKR